MTGPTALCPGSLPGDQPVRNGLPVPRYYTHWRGRPLPVIPVTDERRRAPAERCGECLKSVASKTHRRRCLGIDVPAGESTR
jgi:hypothetical protein